MKGQGLDFATPTDLESRRFDFNHHGTDLV